MSDVDSKLRSWFSELRRRKVIRVAAVYLVAAWLLIQVADAVFEPMGLPAWSIKLVIVLAALGFPLACATAWAFDVTPRGIERTPDVAPQAAVVAPAASPVAVLPVVAPAPPAAAPGESVAILPFVDMSPAKDQEYFCDGIAEEIINALCCIRDLHVASRTSSFQFKGRAADVREIGKALNVGSVLEGSVRKAGDRVRITAQLVSATDGYHLWSESFDRDISDVFAIQTEIAQRLLKALKLTLSRREAEMMERGGTANADAYDLYLRGRLHMRYGTSTLPAAEMFRQAIQRDPQFAQAYAGLANALAMRGIWRLNSTEDETEEAMAASRTLQGFEVDDAVAGHIQTCGYGSNIRHRTGHSIGREVHGVGANMDNMETHDERPIIPWTCCSIEPALYLPDFGVRTEINLFVEERGARVTGEMQTEFVRLG